MMKPSCHKGIRLAIAAIVFGLTILTVFLPRQSAALTITDPFTNSANWDTPFAESGKNMAIANGRMNFTSSTTGGGGAGLTRNTPFLTTTQNWSIKVDVHVDPFTILTEAHGVSVFLGVGKTSDYLGTHILLGFDRDWWDPSYYGVNDDVQVNGVSIPGFTNLNYLPSGDAALRLDFNAANQTITYSYDADGAAGGYNWSALGTTNIASGTYNLNLSPPDTLSVLLAGWSDEQIVTNGQAYLDNLEITISEPPLDYTFITNNGAITITGYTGAGGAITIPSAINGLPVTSIGNSSFRNQYSLTSVTIPNSVTNIGSLAFYVCTGLTNVSIPSSVTNVGSQAFGACLQLPAISVDTLNPIFSSVNGVFFNKDQTTLIQYPAGKAGAYTVPTSVTNISGGAFYLCNYVTSVTIPSTVVSIGVPVFLQCASLNTISVDSLNPVYSSLAGVLFDDNQTTLIQYPAGRIGSYPVPNTVTSIGPYAFDFCVGLTEITIPNSVTLIGSVAFSNCSGLTNVIIPDSIRSIESNAFSWCNSLTNVKLSNNITNIGASTFERCSGLITVTIPANVISISDSAFRDCFKLASVFFNGSAPSLGGSSVFLDSTNIVYYLPATAGWGATYGGRPAILWNPSAQTSGPSFGIKTNRFGFNITGTTNIPIVVEAGTNVSSGPWTPLLSGTLTNGSIYFSDSQWTNYPRRFYRIRSP